MKGLAFSSSRLASVSSFAGALAGPGAALATLACMVAGGALTGHIPGGPGLTILVGALAFALLADARRDGRDAVDIPAARH